jgi:hypothetical protein
LGHSHFRSNYLSATKIGGINTAEDAYINYRATLPAHWVAWYNGDPEMEKLFNDWATAWVEDAMRTDDGKPRGVFPASVGFANDELGGGNSPNWYTAQHPGGTVNYDWQPQKYRAYLEELVRGAYESTGNISLLEPFKLEAELAEAYMDDPVPSPTPGSAAWAGMILGAKAIERWDAIRMDYGIEGGGGMSGEPNGYTPEDVIGMTRMGRRYIDYCLPLMTTEASATDRVAFVGIINPFMIYTGGGVGGALLAPKVTYTGLKRDFAACVMDARPTGVKVLMYGFHHGTKDAGLVLWELENGGTYKVTVGDDNDGDGVVDVVDYTTTFVYMTKGQEVPVKLVGSAEKLVVIEQVGNGTDIRALLPDLAVIGEEISVNGTSGQLEVVVHNIGSNDTGNFTLIVDDADLADNELARVTVPSMDPPRGLLPSTHTISLSLARPPSFGNITVILEAAEEIIEITTLNNRAKTWIDASLLAFNEAPVYVGPEIPVPIVVEEDADLDPPIAVVNVTLLFDDDKGPSNLAFDLTFDPSLPGKFGFQFINMTLYLVMLEENWNGNVSITFSCTDMGSDGVMGGPKDDKTTESPPFLVSVTPVNDPPEYIGPSELDEISVDEDPDLTDPMELVDASGLFLDVDGDPLWYTLDVSQDNRDKVTLDLDDGVVSLVTVEDNWWGDVSFHVTALDGGSDGIVGNEDDATAVTPVYTLSVKPVNDLPFVVGMANRIIIEEGVTHGLDLEPYFEDPDGDVLFYMIELDPDGILEAEINSVDLSDAYLTVDLVDLEFSGFISVKVLCYDVDPTGPSILPDPAILEIIAEVEDGHQPPKFPPSAPIVTHTPDEPVVGDVVTFEASGPIDPYGEGPEFIWRVDGVLKADWSTGASFGYTFDEAGEYEIHTTVRNGAGLTNETTLTISVTEQGVDPPDPDPEPDSGPRSFYTGILVGIIIAVVVIIVALYLHNKRDG